MFAQYQNVHKRAKHVVLQFTELSKALTVFLLDATALFCGLRNLKTIDTSLYMTYVQS